MTIAVCPQRPHRPFPRVRRTSSCVLTTDASAPLCAATSSTTARTSARMRLAARRVGNIKALVFYAHISKCSHAPFVFARSDAKLTDCRSNRTHCGDGDEAHCVTNGTDSFCSCKAGFQKIGHRACGGTRAPLKTAPSRTACVDLRRFTEPFVCVQIRTNVCSLDCAPTSATTPKAPTNAAATSTSPGSATPARLTVRTASWTLLKAH